jgi:hypothetical protein
MNKELASLSEFIRQLAPVLSPGATIPRFGTQDHDLSVVATALFRKSYTHATGMAAVAASEAPEAGVPILRSMLEAYGELQHLLRSSDPREQAQVAFIYSLRELRDYCARTGETEEAQRLSSELAQRDTIAPRAFAEAMKRRNYWTAVSRAELIEAALDALMKRGGGESGGAGKEFYKLLSGDQHHVMVAPLVIQLNLRASNPGTIKTQDLPENPASFLPFMASAVLLGMRDLYLDHFPEVRELLAAG